MIRCQDCKDKPVIKGIKFFICKVCGQDGCNYADGIDICADCRQDDLLCCICGKRTSERRNFAFVVGKRLPGVKEAVLTRENLIALQERLKKYEL